MQEMMGKLEVHLTGIEPVTFGFVDRHCICIISLVLLVFIDLRSKACYNLATFRPRSLGVMSWLYYQFNDVSSILIPILKSFKTY